MPRIFHPIEPGFSNNLDIVLESPANGYRPQLALKETLTFYILQ